LQFCLLFLAGRIDESQQRLIEYLQAEIRVLREQLGRKPRFSNDQRRRLAAKAKRAGIDALRRVVPIVTPETLLKWHRKLIAQKYDGSRTRAPGRPRVQASIERLILRFAQENPAWGYIRIAGALKNLGHAVGRTTVANILKRAGVDPAPQRRRSTSWSEFLRSHWHTLAAADFFTVEVWTAIGLVRYHVFFVMRVATRQVHIAGIIPEPHGRWMEQIARNLTDGFDGFLKGCTYLIHDRSVLYTEHFRSIFLSAGLKSVRLPARSPNLNAFAERFVRSIKEECLDRMIVLGETALRRAVNEFMIHYHTERNHQSLGNNIIASEFHRVSCEGEVFCRERLGGLLRFYHREVA